MPIASGAGTKVLGLALFGDPFDRKSWSGISCSLFSTLQKRGALAGAHTADLALPQKILSALRNFQPSRRAIYLNLMKSELSFRLRSRNAGRIVSQAKGSFNTILQIGALFQVEPPPGVLYCSYHDGNTALSRRPEFSFMAAASPRVMEESLACEQRFYRRVDLMFTMSDWLRRSMIQDFGVREDRVVTVGAGPNISYTNELIGSSRDHSHPREPAILFITTNFEFKGGPTLLDAFRRIRKAVPDAKLWIAGIAPPIDVPGVEPVGFLDKNKPEEEARLRLLMERASVFVLPTLYDCFPASVIEAMFHRLPCVTSNVCSLPEMLRGGEAGFLVPVGDAGQLADCVIQLLQNPGRAEEIGEAGFQYAANHFTWDRVVDRMLKAIESYPARGSAS